MSGSPRRAKVRALAKINLSLQVLHKRPDQYHELRTIFHTISLTDRLEISFTPARKTRLDLESTFQIANNLVVRAAESCLDSMRVTGRVQLLLDKRIPIGAGLGGGSSDAAAVLLTLPVLAGRRLSLNQLISLAAELGSDVPFFLLGGAAVGLGRGAELYPLPDQKPARGVAVMPDVHVSTAQAYASLERGLTSEAQQNKIVSFQSYAWNLAGDLSRSYGSNDFESVVFEQHPRLSSLKRRLLELGAKPVMMTGSGSALFGFFRTREEVNRSIQSLGEENVVPIALVNGARYRSMWWTSLRAHIREKLWPPQSRYAR